MVTLRPSLGSLRAVMMKEFMRWEGTIPTFTEIEVLYTLTKQRSRMRRTYFFSSSTCGLDNSNKVCLIGNEYVTTNKFAECQAANKYLVP